MFFAERGVIGSLFPDNFLLVSIFDGIEKTLDFVQSLRITYELHRIMSQ